MTKSIFCQNSRTHPRNVKIRIVKAPIVDSIVLNQILAQRQKALVL